MEYRIDTGKLTLELVDENYLHLAIYSDGEVTSGDMPPVINFLDQFDHPLPALIERVGTYSLSIKVQIALMQQAKKRLSAVAYVDRNNIHTALTKIAQNTYFRHTQVKSFFEKESALEWLEPFYLEVVG